MIIKVFQSEFSPEIRVGSRFHNMTKWSGAVKNSLYPGYSHTKRTGVITIHVPSRIEKPIMAPPQKVHSGSFCSTFLSPKNMTGDI